ncbi:MAG: TetR/AcrR family transcriptional regulator [Candidatus Marinimicrobia bacterium]|nr:TetR/AcrR family transcriptional regulator [Candidatus Neomarinimicrobiota bacterium]MCF7828520.1 TetR/AcrR family transcriptional regulator [Candidatus Neomarinimicrobiota bacterium]MCF7882057.1 TetR/AcrR family transcriptional regulator [Candidatus Neomarinimicrobiota bacterium]
MVPKRVDKEARRRTILNAAMEIFSKKGLAGTTIQEIAEQAEIGKGTVYEYFDSKDAILAGAFDYLMEEMSSFFVREIRGDMSPEEKLRSFFQGMTQFMGSTHGDVAEMLLVFWAEGILESPVNNAGAVPGSFDLESIYTEYSAILTDIIKEGKRTGDFRSDVNSEHLAAAIIGSLDGLMLQWVIYQKDFPLENIAESYVDMVLKGVQAQ